MRHTPPTTSNLACVGRAVADEAEFDRLITNVIPQAERLGRAGDMEVVRWQDASGARLVLGVAGNQVPDLLPSFAGTGAVQLQGLHMVMKTRQSQRFVDEDGDQTTSLAVEVEQRRLLPEDEPVEAVASIVALGCEVWVFANEVEYEQSDVSLLDPSTKGTEPPPHYVERGLKWPTRMAAESFFSFGVFAERADAEAYARMSGTVVAAERRRVQQTGQEVIVAQLRVIGMDITACLSAGDHRPFRLSAV